MRHSVPVRHACLRRAPHTALIACREKATVARSVAAPGHSCPRQVLLADGLCVFVAHLGSTIVRHGRVIWRRQSWRWRWWCRRRRWRWWCRRRRWRLLRWRRGKWQQWRIWWGERRSALIRGPDQLVVILAACGAAGSHLSGRADARTHLCTLCTRLNERHSSQITLRAMARAIIVTATNGCCACNIPLAHWGDLHGMANIRAQVENNWRW